VIRKLNHREHAVAEEILAVQLPAYRIEADLVGFDGIPALHDTLETLMACETEEFYGTYRDERLAGMIACEPEGTALCISRVVVHPDFFRQGIGRLLVTELEAVARENSSVDRLRVMTGVDNAPAVKLYRSLGFVDTDVREVAPGVQAVFLEKSLG
jgi:ribosomal protein S18 acetylase RimI-like enzyme